MGMNEYIMRLLPYLSVLSKLEKYNTSFNWLDLK